MANKCSCRDEFSHSLTSPPTSHPAPLANTTGPEITPKICRVTRPLLFRLHLNSSPLTSFNFLRKPHLWPPESGTDRDLCVSSQKEAMRCEHWQCLPRQSFQLAADRSIHSWLDYQTTTPLCYG